MSVGIKKVTEIRVILSHVTELHELFYTESGCKFLLFFSKHIWSLSDLYMSRVSLN